MLRFVSPRSVGRLLALVSSVAMLAACAPAAAPTTAPASPPQQAPAATTAPQPAATSSGAPAASPAPATSGTDEVETVTMGLVVNFNSTPVFVGIEKGIFLKHGVDLKMKLVASGPEANKALQAGDVELGTGNFATLTSSRSSGAKLKGFYLLQDDPTVPNNDEQLALIVPPDSPIQSVSDLKGKRVGITSGGAVDPYMRITLQEAGVDPQDVDLINATFANMPSALMGGGLDAALFLEPYGEVYLSQNPGARVLQRGGGKVSFRILALAREDWLASNGPLVEKLTAALAEASQYSRQHQEEAALISARLLTGITPEIATAAIRHYDYDPRISKLIEASWNHEGETLLEQNRIQALIPMSEAFDTSFTEKVMQEHPEYFSDLEPLPQ